MSETKRFYSVTIALMQKINNNEDYKISRICLWKAKDFKNVENVTENVKDVEMKSSICL